MPDEQVVIENVRIMRKKGMTWEQITEFINGQGAGMVGSHRSSMEPSEPCCGYPGLHAGALTPGLGVLLVDNSCDLRHTLSISLPVENLENLCELWAVCCNIHAHVRGRSGPLRSATFRWNRLGWKHYVGNLTCG